MSYKAYQFKLQPTNDQLDKLRQFGGATRFIYNYFLALAVDTYREESRHIGFSEMCRLLTQLKKTNEYSWLKDIHSQVLQQSLKDLGEAYKNFFRKLKQGDIPKNPDGTYQRRKNGQIKCSPNFKKKSHFADSFRYPASIKVDENYVWLPKIGWVKFRKSRDTVGTIKSATVSQRPSGLYVSIVCETPDTKTPPTIEPTLENSVGIDVGVSSLLVESNGHKVPALKAYRKLERKLKREQRKLSRKKKGSNNKFKQQYNVARLHERIANMRGDYAHQHSTRLVRENQAIFAETLNVKGMMQNRNLAKSIADASMGMLLTLIEQKAKQHGKTFHKIDRWYPSSKTCHCCGYKLDKLALHVRMWQCPECGETHDRDINASINILLEGLRQVGAGHSQT